MYFNDLDNTDNPSIGTSDYTVEGFGIGRCPNAHRNLCNLIHDFATGAKSAEDLDTENVI